MSSTATRAKRAKMSNGQRVAPREAARRTRRRAHAEASGPAANREETCDGDADAPPAERHTAEDESDGDTGDDCASSASDDESAEIEEPHSAQASAGQPMTSNYRDRKRKGPEQPVATTRGRRGGHAPNYDETRRRAAKRQKRSHHAYMDRGSGPRRKGVKRSAVVIGTAVIERIVRGRYSWRDSGRDGRRR